MGRYKDESVEMPPLPSSLCAYEVSENRNMSSPETFLRLADCCWAVFAVYWIVSAFQQKAEKRKEPWGERMAYILPLVAVAAFFNWRAARYGWLGGGLVPFSTAVGIAGLLMTGAGVALAIWARRHIGRNWSAVVSIRADHELIGTGPYRRIRHPIYTGILLALAGTGLLIGEPRVLIGFAIACVVFYLKARKEEKWLVREFGERFATHARNTGMFLPKLS
jgi:protein-S-isoprenylcysteine O-methyltransferase Ste14